MNFEGFTVEEVIRSGSGSNFMPMNDKLIEEEFPCIDAKGVKCPMFTSCANRRLACSSFVRYAGCDVKKAVGGEKFRMMWPSLPRLPTVEMFNRLCGIRKKAKT